MHLVVVQVIPILLAIAEQVLEVAHPNVAIHRRRLGEVIAELVVFIGDIFTRSLRLRVCSLLLFNQPLIISLVSQARHLVLLGVIRPAILFLLLIVLHMDWYLRLLLA